MQLRGNNYYSKEYMDSLLETYRECINVNLHNPRYLDNPWIQIHTVELILTVYSGLGVE